MWGGVFGGIAVIGLIIVLVVSSMSGGGSGSGRPTATRIPAGDVPTNVRPATAQPATAAPAAPAPPTQAPAPTWTPVPPTEAPALAPGLIAYYPLTDNANDSTGNYPPITLQNAPFQDGGVYCNGVYIHSANADNACNIITPQLDGLRFDSLSISVRFLVSTYRDMPLFVGGDSYRWLGFALHADGTVGLMYNNSYEQNCAGNYSPGNWHEAAVTYDGSVGRLYLDRGLICAVAFSLEHGNDKNIGTANFSNATVFEGIIGDLRVYDTVIVP